MKLYNEDILKMVNDELLDFIYEDTFELVSNYIINVINKNYSVFDSYNDFMNRVKNVIELIIRYQAVENNAIPCNVALLLVELTKLSHYIYSCDYDFKEKDTLTEEPKIVNDLDDYINLIASDFLVEIDSYFTVKDVQEYVDKFNKKEQEEITLKNERRLSEENDLNLIDEYLKNNAITDFDFSVLGEDERYVLTTLLEKDIKHISISHIQRRFSYGFTKAAKIIDNLEKAGAISSVEEAKKFGFVKYLRIIKVKL